MNADGSPYFIAMWSELPRPCKVTCQRIHKEPDGKAILGNRGQKDGDQRRNPRRLHMLLFLKQC